MRSLRLLLVDDELPALRRLEFLIRQIDGVEHGGSASGYREAIDATSRVRPDVILLDIRMRDGSGFDVLRELPADSAPEIIFVTAFDTHAVDAFAHQALDFLLKPLDLGRLATALDRARQRIDERDRAARTDELQQVIGNLRNELRGDIVPRFDTEIWVRKNITGFVRIAVSDIDWVSAEEDYVRISLCDKTYLLRSTLGEMQDRLDPDKFLRIHRSTIVRRSAVTAFQRDAFGFHACLSSGRRLRVSRVYAKHIRHDFARSEGLRSGHRAMTDPSKVQAHD